MTLLENDDEEEIHDKKSRPSCGRAGSNSGPSEPLPSSRKGRKRILVDDEEEEEEDNQRDVTDKLQSNRIRLRGRTSIFDEEDLTGDEEVVDSPLLSRAYKRRCNSTGSTSQKRNRRPKSLLKEGPYSDDDCGSEDMNDFIVHDDGDEDEVGALSVGSSPEPDIREFIVGEDYIEMMEEEEGQNMANSGKHRQSWKMRSNSRSKKKKKEGESKKQKSTRNERGTSTKRRTIVLESDENSSSSSSEEEEEESSADEGMLHRQIHAAYEMEQDEVLPVFMSRKTVSMGEAFTLYVEMLARCLLDASFLKGMKVNPFSSTYGRFSNAKSMVEKTLCTKRESLLGSMAWRPEFLLDLRSLPYFQALELMETGGAHLDRCEVCGRSRHPCTYQLVLSGPRYDSLSLWESSSRWSESLPCSLENLGTPLEKDEFDFDRKTYFSGSTCKYKTHCYSSMIHYKYVLLSRIARRIRRDQSKERNNSNSTAGMSIEDFLSDTAFLESEHERFMELLDLVDDTMLDAGSSSSNIAKKMKRLERIMAVNGPEEETAKTSPRRSEARTEEEDEEEDDEMPCRRRSRGYDPYARFG